LAGDINNESDAVAMLSAIAHALPLQEVCIFLAILKAQANVLPDKQMGKFTYLFNTLLPLWAVVLHTQAEQAFSFLKHLEEEAFCNHLEENEFVISHFLPVGSTMGTWA